MPTSIFTTVEYALKSAVDAGKYRSDAADTAFATAEEELDWYAAWHYPKQQLVPIHSIHFVAPFANAHIIQGSGRRRAEHSRGCRPERQFHRKNTQTVVHSSRP